jgi:predicted DsbA family dithiol-disulfide isomerase
VISARRDCSRETPEIDIISDVVCPWCFIGKRQIEAALALYAQQNPGAEPPRVTWRPFQLNPQLPAEGKSARPALLWWKDRYLGRASRGEKENSNA